jgi:hypothetical protein
VLDDEYNTSHAEELYEKIKGKIDQICSEHKEKVEKS